MVESACVADLVIMAHEDAENDRCDQRGAHAQVIRDSGRSVLVVPLRYDGPEIGADIIVGWSDTREAARAAHDLLTVADAGAPFTVMRIEHTPTDAVKDDRGIDLAEMYARHGLKTTLEHRPNLGGNIADGLNKIAFEKASDLIVTGAFGHSKTYDFVLGATTYALLREAKLPVLFCK